MKRLLTIALLLITSATALAASKQYYSYTDATQLKDSDRLLVFQNNSGSRNITGATLKSLSVPTVAGDLSSYWSTIANSGTALLSTFGQAGHDDSTSLTQMADYINMEHKTGGVADSLITVNAAGVTLTGPAITVNGSNLQTTLDSKVKTVNTQTAETQATELIKQNWFTAGAAPLEWHTQSYPNPGGVGTYNHATHMGFNVGRHSSLPATANKPSLIMGFEDNYYDNGGDNTHGMEWYIEYFSPDGTSVQMLRPFYTRVLADTNARKAANTWFKIGNDNDYSQFAVMTGYDAANLLTITPTAMTAAPLTTFTNATDAADAVTASVILKGGLWSDKTVYANGGIKSGSGVYSQGNITYNTTSDRAAMGIMPALPTSSAGAYLGWASGISGTLTGDMLLIPRTSVAGSLRVFTGNGTPAERLVVDGTGNTRMGTSTNNTTIAADGAVTFTGTGKLPYGSMYVEEGALTTTVTTAHTYYPITTGLLGGTSSGFTFQNGSELKCLVAGKYLVNWSLSLSSNQGDTTIEGAVMVNSTGAVQTANATKAKEATQVYSVGGTGILNLAVNDLVKLSVERVDGAAATITINHANLTLLHIGG